MATTKKRTTRKKVAPPSEPVAAETKVEEPEAKAEDEAQKVVVPPPPPVKEPETAPNPVKPKRVEVYSITLLQGKTYGFKGRTFVAGQPLVTSDAKLFEALRHNGRFRVDVREGGTK
jgi:hypothetical protein